MLPNAVTLSLVRSPLVDCPMIISIGEYTFDQIGPNYRGTRITSVAKVEHSLGLTGHNLSLVGRSTILAERSTSQEGHTISTSLIGHRCMTGLRVETDMELDQPTAPRSQMLPLQNFCHLMPEVL